MRYFGILLALILVPAAAPGQDVGRGAIHGTVVAAGSGGPLSAVSVAVRTAADSSIVGGEITDADGGFRVSGLTPGRYLVQASSLGYTPVTREVTLTRDEPNADLGTIPLSVSAISLEGINIEAERSAIAIAPDRTIYNTSEMPVASGGTATDVLQGVPELEVDISGSVSLRGTAPQIHINGRPAPMEGEALNVFLQQFPADRIERIEVIPNPSARYQAEGAAGIVNIVLKKDVDLGLSGSVFLNGGTRGNAGGGGRLTYQRGPLTFFGGSFLRYSDRTNASYDLRQNLLVEPTTFLEQDATSDETQLSGSLDLTAELELSERAILWAEVQTYRSGSESDRLTAYTEMDAGRDPTERYDRASTGESTRRSMEFAAGWDHVFEPRRHEVSVELEYETGGDEGESLIRERAFALDGGDAVLPVELTTEDTGEDERAVSIEVDYFRPWGDEGQIEVGYRGDFEDTDEGRLLEVFPDVDAPEPSTVMDRGFAFRDVSNGAYLMLTRSLGERFGVQAGLRAERADTRLELPTGETFENTYSSLFPSMNLSYDLDDERQLRFSYSRRVRRPSPWVLNPIDRSTDPRNRSIGNPDIDPQYTHSVSVETSWRGQAGTLRFSPYYRRTQDDWARIQTLNEEGIATTTWENLASIESYGTSLTASLRPVGGIGGFVSLSGYREVRDASNLALDYSGTAMRWQARANLQARVTPSLNLQGMLYYRPAHDVTQGRVGSTIMTHFGLRQDLFGDRASLNLRVTDPFNLFEYSFENRDPTYVQIGSSTRRVRSAVLSFSYSFGRPPEDERDRGPYPADDGGEEPFGPETP